MSNTSKARQRILSLLDNNSFVEIGARITARATDFNLQTEAAPSDGVITGYGVINDNPVYVYAQDGEVLGGSVGEMHARKIAGVYDMAMKMGAPVIGLIDSTGFRLKESFDALNGYGEILAASALASGEIPQICGVFGSCGGGLSVIPAMSDFVFMEKGARLFVNSPDAIEGNNASKCDNSAAAFQYEEAGNVDIVEDEAAVFTAIRDLFDMLPLNNEGGTMGDCSDDLNRSCDGIESYLEGDITDAVKTIADNGRFFPVRAGYAADMVTGLIKLNGDTVGVVANNNTALSGRGCEKASGFVAFCDAFEIPLITITNTEALKACMCCERRLPREAAKLAMALANATVPKVNLIAGKAFGSAGVLMNSKAIGADMVFAWDCAAAGTMDARLAAQIICDDRTKLEETAKAYNSLQNSIDSAAARGYVDTIISPRDTRKYLIGALDMLYTKAVDIPDKKHVSKM